MRMYDMEGVPLIPEIRAFSLLLVDKRKICIENSHLGRLGSEFGL